MPVFRSLVAISRSWAPDSLVGCPGPLCPSSSLLCSHPFPTFDSLCIQQVIKGKHKGVLYFFLFLGQIILNISAVVLVFANLSPLALFPNAISYQCISYIKLFPSAKRNLLPYIKEVICTLLQAFFTWSDTLVNNIHQTGWTSGKEVERLFAGSHIYSL